MNLEQITAKKETGIKLLGVLWSCQVTVMVKNVLDRIRLGKLEAYGEQLGQRYVPVIQSSVYLEN